MTQVETAAADGTAALRELSEQERKAALARAVAAQVRDGWHVQSQTDFQAVLVKGKRTSHGLHLFLSFITLGLWLFVWAIVWFLNRDQHKVVDVDPYGHVNLEGS